MSGYVALQIDQYADFSRVITINTSTGTPQNLAGYVVTSKLRRSYYSTANANSFTVLVTDGANGQVTLTMTAANTGNLIPGRYVFDVTMNTGTLIQRIIEGIVVVNPGVTH